MTAGRNPAAIGGGRPGTAVAVRTRPGAVALPAGGGTSHGEWEQNTGAVLGSLARLFRHAQLMTDTLTAKDGPADLIDDISNWADRISTAGQQILDDFLLINDKIGPYIQAVMDAGGPAQVASPQWHEDY